MKGQVSLELILLMSVFFSVLLLFMPLISKTFFLGIYALDSLKAKDFSDSFTVSVTELNSMSNESSIKLTAEPSLEWEINAEENKLTVEILSEECSKKKTFVSEQFNLIPFEKTLKEKTVFILTKTENGILTEIQKA